MKRKITYSAIIFLLTSFSSITAQQVQKASFGAVLLENATVHTITGEVLSDSDVLISEGLIEAVGQNLDHGDAQVIDCDGLHVYPGLIDAGTQLGLGEIGAVSLTNDHREIGDLIPHMQALTAVNPNSVAIPVTRVNGVTTVFSYPTGGLFPGTGALIDLFGYTPDQMSSGAKGVVMNFPSSGRRGRWDRRSDEDIKKAYDKKIKKIDEIWSKLKTYALIDSAVGAGAIDTREYLPEYDALLPVFKGEAKLFVEANKAEDIEAALKWIEKNHINAVITGALEGWRAVEAIAQAGVPVITGPVLSVPGREYVRYDANYTNAAKMMEAGIKVAIRTDDTENVRNLPFNAGFAAAYGMGVDEALKAVTINTAEIFGVDDKYGSIEVGKVANLIVTDGDPFETKTSLKHLFIRGWHVPLESRHTLLYEEFLDRSPGN